MQTGHSKADNNSLDDGQLVVLVIIAVADEEIFAICGATVCVVELDGRLLTSIAKKNFIAKTVYKLIFTCCSLNPSHCFLCMRNSYTLIRNL